MGFSRQEYWSGLPCRPPGDLRNPGIKPRSPALQADSLPSEPPGKPKVNTPGLVSGSESPVLPRPRRHRHQGGLGGAGSGECHGNPEALALVESRRMGWGAPGGGGCGGEE